MAASLVDNAMKCLSTFRYLSEIIHQRLSLTHFYFSGRILQKLCQVSNKLIFTCKRKALRRYKYSTSLENNWFFLLKTQFRSSSELQNSEPLSVSISVVKLKFGFFKDTLQFLYFQSDLFVVTYLAKDFSKALNAWKSYFLIQILAKAFWLKGAYWDFLNVFSAGVAVIPQICLTNLENKRCTYDLNGTLSYILEF